MKKWENYYDITNNIPPRKNIVHFLSKYKLTGNAIDLGCGSGNDTIFLIKNKWNVLAIDASDVEERIRSKLLNEEQKRLKFEIQKFENLKLSKCDLIISNNSLSFCDKKFFHQMWLEIYSNIKTNGYFVGNFFGVNDEWNNNNTNKSFFSKDDVIKLFNNFKILDIKEIEIDKPTATGILKHWHIIEIIAKKTI
ncbi:MAG: class I SAM-dependent methyltransferase [Clostridiales bacterium]|nr:class I SAM-dependent methyltransferase [Clostridiales bacterium]